MADTVLSYHVQAEIEFEISQDAVVTAEMTSLNGDKVFQGKVNLHQLPQILKQIGEAFMKIDDANDDQDEIIEAEIIKEPASSI